MCIHSACQRRRACCCCCCCLGGVGSGPLSKQRLRALHQRHCVSHTYSCGPALAVRVALVILRAVGGGASRCLRVKCRHVVAFRVLCLCVSYCV